MTTKKNRDEFSKHVIDTVAKRAGYQCSKPDCNRITIGPHSDDDKTLSTGTAQHICGAASGGPRYDISQTSPQRKSIKNAIWLCEYCAPIIDKDEAEYPTTLLKVWKKDHEEKIRNLQRSNKNNGSSKNADNDFNILINLKEDEKIILFCISRAGTNGIDPANIEYPMEYGRKNQAKEILIKKDLISSVDDTKYLVNTKGKKVLKCWQNQYSPKIKLIKDVFSDKYKFDVKIFFNQNLINSDIELIKSEVMKFVSNYEGIAGLAGCKLNDVYYQTIRATRLGIDNRIIAKIRINTHYNSYQKPRVEFWPGTDVMLSDVEPYVTSFLEKEKAIQLEVEQTE